MLKACKKKGTLAKLKQCLCIEFTYKRDSSCINSGTVHQISAGKCNGVILDNEAADNFRLDVVNEVDVISDISDWCEDSSSDSSSTSDCGDDCCPLVA